MRILEYPKFSDVMPNEAAPTLRAPDMMVLMMTTTQEWTNS
jgi:hypothetical protein